MEGDGIVFAARASNAGKADPFPFDTIKSLRGTQWNSSSNTFTVKEAYGLYFMSLCVTPVNGQKAGYALMLSENTFGGITRKSTAFQDRDVISHDFMIRLYAGETLHISNEYDTYGYPIHLDTSLSVFSISHSMTNDRVAFSVANEQTVIGFLEPFPFTNYLYNDGLHYDIIGNTFTAPIAGIYYFSFSIGLVAGGTARFVLYKNGSPFASIKRNATTHNGDDTIGRSVMMSLDEWDSVYMVNEDGQVARSSQMLETSFSGFLYSPKHGVSVCNRCSNVQH